MQQGSQKQSPRRRWLSAILKYVVPLVISVGLCYLLFRGIDINEMIAIVRDQCSFGWIAAALALSLFSYVFRALRWNLQLEALGIHTPLFYLVLSMFGTYAVNLVFPRLGEVWRSGYIAQRQKAPFTEVLGSMVAERLADTITVGLITLLAFALASGAIIDYLSGNGEMFKSIMNLLSSPWLWMALLAFVAGFWWMMKRKTENRIVNKIRSIIKSLWQGFAVIGSMPGKKRWLLWTACVWGCYYTQLLITFMAFPATTAVLADYGLTPSLVAFALSSISMGVPANGGIGPWQWAIIFALSIYGVDNAVAGAYANVVLGSQTLLQIILGIFTFIMIALDRKKTAIRTK